MNDTLTLEAPTASDQPGAAGRPQLRDLLRAASVPAGLYVVSRVVTLVAATVAALLRPPFTPHVVVSRLTHGLASWDGAWYVATARHWYPSTLPHHGGHVLASTIAFFPLFPLTMRALSLATGMSLTVSGLLLSSVFGLVATIGVWALSRALWGPRAALRASAAFCFFPGAFVFSMIYSEGLVLALAAGCLLALLRRRWVLAGILAGLATATRPNAIALVVACAWAALVALYQRRDWRSLAAPVLSVTGLVGYFAYLWRLTGDSRAWFQTQTGGWHQHVTATATWHELVSFAHHPFHSLNFTVVVLCLVFVVVAGALLLAARVPGPVLLYAAVVVALSAFSTVLGMRPRFLLMAFPLVTVLGYRLRGSAFHALLAAESATMALLMVITVATPLLTP